MRQEISRLRVSSKRFPSTPPYRHVPPLEMTVAADASLVISMVGAEWRHPTLQIAETPPCTPLVISTVAGQPPIGKPLIVQARGPTSADLETLCRVSTEWRNLTPPWSREHGGRRSLDSEYHRSGFHLPPYRHVPSLEMTVAAGTPLVISTKAERSGEISLHQ